MSITLTLNFIGDVLTPVRDEPEVDTMNFIFEKSNINDNASYYQLLKIKSFLIEKRIFHTNERTCGCISAYADEGMHARITMLNTTNIKPEDLKRGNTYVVTFVIKTKTDGDGVHIYAELEFLEPYNPYKKIIPTSYGVKNIDFSDLFL
jgi:hypothetical protein